MQAETLLCSCVCSLACAAASDKTTLPSAQASFAVEGAVGIITLVVVIVNVAGIVLFKERSVDVEKEVALILGALVTLDRKACPVRQAE